MRLGKCPALHPQRHCLKPDAPQPLPEVHIAGTHTVFMSWGMRLLSFLLAHTMQPSPWHTRLQHAQGSPK